MKISELSRTAGVSVPTVKYYLREQLLPPGRSTAANQAEYDDEHLGRLRVIRALVEVGGLPLASVRAVLAAIDAGPQGLPDAIRRAHEALGSAVEPDADPPRRALEALGRLGWRADAGSTSIRQLDDALAAAESVGVPVDPEALRAYATAAMAVAQRDIESIPSVGDPAGAGDAVAHVVLSTVIYEPMLLALRRLAQQEIYRNRLAARRPDPR